MLVPCLLQPCTPGTATSVLWKRGDSPGSAVICVCLLSQAAGSAKLGCVSAVMRGAVGRRDA